MAAACHIWKARRDMALRRASSSMGSDDEFQGSEPAPRGSNARAAEARSDACRGRDARGGAANGRARAIRPSSCAR
eukprot:5212293-Pyramimonas_sp.AAC.1